MNELVILKPTLTNFNVLKHYSPITIISWSTRWVY